MKEGNIDTATPTARTAPVAGIAAAAGKAPAAGKATLVAEKPADEPDPPRVWLIDPYRAGERSQVRAIADALQWPYEIKHLGYRKLAARVNLLRGSDLSGLISATRPQLRAPWPQLLITAGMRKRAGLSLDPGSERRPSTHRSHRPSLGRLHAFRSGDHYRPSIACKSGLMCCITA